MATESEIDGEEEAKHNPKWMKTQKYSWLAPQLEYEFQIELSHLNRSMNAKLIIEPFSRTIPMRLEAQLDKLVEDHVFGVRGLPKNIKTVPKFNFETELSKTYKDLDGNPGVKPANRKRARSLTMASVGQYGTGTKAADDPLSKLPFTPAYKEQKPQTKPRKKK
ncbi:hypothetical protein BDZ97DRAFT_1856929 [Flammula alnicola]|nr:hypothetical protein BDZ97DRAFT_1856929 [Flammula alnicola]